MKRITKQLAGDGTVLVHTVSATFEEIWTRG